MLSSIINILEQFVFYFDIDKKNDLLHFNTFLVHVLRHLQKRNVQKTRLAN